MEFRTPIEPLKQQGLLKHGDCCLMLGSCFTDEMSRRLRTDGFDVAANPGGPLFNPLSILAWIARLAANEPFALDDLVPGPDNRFHTWLHHTLCSRSDRQEALDVANEGFARAAYALRNARAVFLTLGSTRYFRLADSGLVVTNCHKHHPATFIESRLGLEECQVTLNQCVELIRKVNAGAEIVWTVSPVRHPGQGGLHANALSKSTLLLATEAAEGVYFPAYEALTDDLRDYRFYAADMRHPSDVAADYIYSLLCESFMTSDTLTRALEVRRATRRQSHRPNVRQ